MNAKVKKKPSGKGKKSVGSFFGELKQELKKVSWTTKPDLIAATKVVVISTVIFGIGIYVVDLVVKGVLTLIKNLTQLVFG